MHVVALLYTGRCPSSSVAARKRFYYFTIYASTLVTIYCAPNRLVPILLIVPVHFSFTYWKCTTHGWTGKFTFSRRASNISWSFFFAFTVGSLKNAAGTLIVRTGIPVDPVSRGGTYNSLVVNAESFRCCFPFLPSIFVSTCCSFCRPRR